MAGSCDVALRWPLVDVCTVVCTVVGMLGSELEGTQPRLRDVGCVGSRLGVGGRRRSGSVLTARILVKSFPFMPSFGFLIPGVTGDVGDPGECSDSCELKGLAMPGTENTKLNGNGMVADGEDDSGERTRLEITRKSRCARGRHARVTP